MVRHGQSETNRDHVRGGHSDSLLTELGVQQANETKRLLAGINFDAVYSSDLQRALKTTEILSGKSVPKAHQLASLRERSYGTLEGKPDALWLKLDKQFNEKYRHLPLDKRWRQNYEGYDIETSAELCGRFLGALQDIAHKHPGGTVLVGTHGGCIRATLIKLGYAEEYQLPPNSFANSAYIVLSFDKGKFTIKKTTGVTLASKQS